jgi:UPF0755 protein
MSFFQKIDTHVATLLTHLDRIQQTLSTRWRENSNRRTVLVLLFCASLSTYAYLTLIAPPDEFPVDELVTIPSGLSVTEIGDVLARAHLVRSPIMFRVMETVLGHDRDLRAGDYVFKEPLDVYTLARRIGIGAYGLEPRRIRIPEGSTMRHMSTILRAQLPHFNSEHFLARTSELEGYLFPDTYFFLPNATEDTVIAAMRQNFDLHRATIQKQIDAFAHPLADVVTMASIVELEAFNTADRRMIAGVLWNRIKRHMALQADVTVIYATGNARILRTDLATTSVYNTYTHPGLPPGPIGSPSMDSLIAAVTPTKTDALFYLAGPDGVTHFSNTYEEHVRNIGLYLGR